MGRPRKTNKEPPVSASKSVEDYVKAAKSSGKVSDNQIISFVSSVNFQESDTEEILNILKRNNVEIDSYTDDNGNLVADTSALDEIPEDVNSKDLTSLQIYLKQISQISLLTPEEEKLLTERAHAGDKKAKDLLTQHNLRLVVYVAKKYRNSGMAFEDLLQEGTLGLMRAVEKFEPSRNFRFSTYATWWIRQGITRAIADQSKTIRIPVHMVELLNKIAKARHRLSVETNREPTHEDIAKELGVAVEKIDHILSISQHPVSLETPVGEDGSTMLGELIPDSVVEDPMENLLSEEKKRQILAALETLSTREMQILKMRYGIGVNRVYTLEEIGKEFNITRERIRQIENRAIKKLGEPARRKMLIDFAPKR